MCNLPISIYDHDWISYQKDVLLKLTTARAAIAAVILFVGVFGALRSGRYLVVNQPERSDVIVVLAGDHNDLRYWRGLELLREGYGQQMLLDASSDRIYGRTYAEYASDFIARSAGEQRSQLSICVIANDSTVQEASDIRTCLERMNPAHAVGVTGHKRLSHATRAVDYAFASPAIWMVCCRSE